MDIYTIRTGAAQINRSELWLRLAINLGRIKATKIGNRWLIQGEELRKFLAQPFQITKKEITY